MYTDSAPLFSIYIHTIYIFIKNIHTIRYNPTYWVTEQVAGVSVSRGTYEVTWPFLPEASYRVISCGLFRIRHNYGPLKLFQKVFGVHCDIKLMDE